MARADTIVYVDLPFGIHLWWAAKRQVISRVRRRAWAGQSAPPPSLVLFRTLRRVHAMRSDLLALVTKGDREAKFLSVLEELSGKLQAVLLNDQLERIGDKVAVRDLADTLKKDTPGVSTVVFDGVVTQRLIDIALDKKIGTLVGVKTGNITKKPNSVEVVTRADLA